MSLFAILLDVRLSEYGQTGAYKTNTGVGFYISAIRVTISATRMWIATEFKTLNLCLRRVFIFVFSTSGLENDLSPMIISWVTRSDVVIVKSI